MEEARARARNQGYVRLQRKVYNLDREDGPAKKGKGLCRVVIETELLQGMTTDHQEECLERSIDAVKKKLREAVAEKGGIVDTITSHRLLNGNIEVRCGFTVKRD